MRGMIAGLTAVLTIALALAAQAHPAVNSGKAEDQYRPAIWIDPDGCQHWVMDDGQRGFMDPVRTADGKPVCLRGARAASDKVFPDPAVADAWRPAIWIDPDGCQHWVMDEKGKGFMDLVLDHHGRPVCNRSSRTPRRRHTRRPAVSGRTADAGRRRPRRQLSASRRSAASNIPVRGGERT